MRISAKSLKTGAKLQKSQLYCLSDGQIVDFKESQTDGTVDWVQIKATLKEGQLAFYAEEYSPSVIAGKTAKKVDILALTVDSLEKKIGSWVLDVKETVGGDDVIFHLVKQLKFSLQYKDELCSYIRISDEGEAISYSETERIGYITREVHTERIKQSIQSRREQIEKAKEAKERLPLYVQSNAGVLTNQLEQQKELEILNRFYHNELVCNGKVYPLECRLMKPFDDTTYTYTLELSC